MCKDTRRRKGSAESGAVSFNRALLPLISINTVFLEKFTREKDKKEEQGLYNTIFNNCGLVKVQELPA